MGYVVNEELEAILESEEFDEFGEAFLSHVVQDSTGLKLVFDLKPLTSASQDSTW
jgi:hypothetical protein